MQRLRRERISPETTERSNCSPRFPVPFPFPMRASAACAPPMLETKRLAHERGAHEAERERQGAGKQLSFRVLVDFYSVRSLSEMLVLRAKVIY